MVNVYFITIEVAKHRIVLTWTADTNPSGAWSKLVKEWGRFVNGDTKKEKVTGLKRCDKARLLKVSVEGEGAS